MKKAVLIKQMIEETGMSLKTFATKANLPYTTLYSMLERGVGNASVNNAIKICKTLNISVEQLDDISNGVHDYNYLTFAVNDDFTISEKREIMHYLEYVKYRRTK